MMMMMMTMKTTMIVIMTDTYSRITKTKEKTEKKQKSPGETCFF